MGIKAPQLQKLDWFYICAAWQKNEIEKRAAWLSPTYRQWNPKLPWGTSADAFQNARLEPWRRWNWLTDGTPNKWLNVPYEYPWYMPSAQLGLQVYSNRYNVGVFPVGRGIVDIPTGDVAKWNPDAYATRDGPYLAEDKETLEYEEEVTIPEDRLLEREYYTGTRLVYCTTTYTVPELRIRYKGQSQDENDNSVWPMDENGVEQIGTLYRAETTKKFKASGEAFQTAGRYVDDNGVELIESYFYKGRLGPPTALWKYTDTFHQIDTRRKVEFHYEVEYYKYVMLPVYYCEGQPPGNRPPFYLKTDSQWGTYYLWETRVLERKEGNFVRMETKYSDAFKKGAYEKKHPYPCYKKPDSPYLVSGYRETHMMASSTDRPYGAAGFFPGILVYFSPDGQQTLTDFGDPKAEVFGDVPGSNFYGGLNTWYQKYSYKPSQHWADGWGIRNESSNFYADPEYHVGTIYNGISKFPEDGLEADPIAMRNPESDASKFNMYFWKGSHKMVHPYIMPGPYWGNATVDELGMPRSANPSPKDYQKWSDYLKENNLNSGDLPYSTDYVYNRWHTHPINHNSANDLYRGLFKEAGVDTEGIEDASSFHDALAQVTTPPGMPNIFNVPAFPPPSGAMLDSVYLFNDLCLVPTDWVHTPWSPQPLNFIVEDKTRALIQAKYTKVKSTRWQKTYHNWILEGMLGQEPIKEWWDGKPLSPATVFDRETLELVESEEWVQTEGEAAEFPLRRILYSWGPSVRDPLITLANYPTGFEIDPRHETLCQSRLVGETEMNNRCESIPNWLDTDGGLLFQVVGGYTAINEASRIETSYFYFMLQARLPSAHKSHQGVTFDVELNFSKKTTKTINKPIDSSYTQTVSYDIERRKIELHFPPDDGQNARFDGTYYPKDTDPGRGKPPPPSEPNVWEGPSTYPEYDNWQSDGKGGAVKKGAVIDKRDWQAHGTQRVISSSVVSRKFTTTALTPEGETPVSRYKKSPGRKLKRRVAPFLDPPAQPSWEDYEDENSAQWVGPSYETILEELTLEDVKITNIRGQTYRSFVDGGPATPP